MIPGEFVVMDPISQQQPVAVDGRSGILESALEQIRDALRGLRYGSVNVIVQDGVVIQIDRTEKRRLHSTRNRSNRGIAAT